MERAAAFLMVEEERGGPHTLFTQPAGHLEPGERIRDAALREVEEETAWRVGISDYLGMYVLATPDGLTFHSHAFLGMALAPLGHALAPPRLAGPRALRPCPRARPPQARLRAVAPPGR